MLEASNVTFTLDHFANVCSDMVLIQLPQKIEETSWTRFIDHAEERACRSIQEIHLFCLPHMK